eukprot:m.491412 g.491412  ORF g.491412 m.491412 type:complete len:276 (-) comp57260_c0_seq2:2430-3257(-)
MSNRCRNVSMDCPNYVNRWDALCPPCVNGECLNCGKRRHQGFLYCGKSCAAMYKAKQTQQAYPGAGAMRQQLGAQVAAVAARSGQWVQPQPPQRQQAFQAQPTPIDFPLHARFGKAPLMFYNKEDPFYEFTNFAAYPLTIAGKTYPTSEHYFQSMKFVLTPFEDDIAKAPTPRDAFDLTRQEEFSRWRRSDWDAVKNDVMLRALREKFTQYEHLYHLLLSTGDRHIIEHTANDTYWADGGDGTGKNMLGHLLMQVRGELKAGNLIRNPTHWTPLA